MPIAASIYQPNFPESPDSPKQFSDKDVFLFPDTFVNYHEPAIGLAVVALLEYAGWNVVVGRLDQSRCKIIREANGQCEEYKL